MARKALIVKCAKPKKFSTRNYHRCSRCGRVHGIIKQFGICRICLREMAYKGEIPGMHKSSW
jgi:small subunit ribosomal protein S14